MDDLKSAFDSLKAKIAGDVFTDETSRLLYATDASVYREIPLAVVRPKTVEDIKNIIAFARENKTSIIPRTAGTSLAGQVVGGGMVADVSKFMTEILEFNDHERWVRVQPGVILDELNKTIEPAGLFFSPETSTSNRCMIGGMVGNNSCGSHSILYGSTRDHIISMKGILSDGSEVEFSPLTNDEFYNKCSGASLENTIYRKISELLSNPANQDEIRAQYPDKSLKRRNTGYAIDLLLETEPFTPQSEKFNFCKLIAGSEGTLVFITEIKLHLDPLPPKEEALICIHLHSVRDAFRANLIALKFSPGAVEMIDHVILECTKGNIEQSKNRFFVSGDPGAILVVEFARESKNEILTIKDDLERDMRAAGFGYHFPVVFGPEIKKVWSLRKAGLGLMSNIPGDRKPVSVIEDTAVSPDVYPEYMDEFEQMLIKYGLSCVYYGHLATGELHLKPVLNLRDPADVELFHTVALDTAKLVKKYKGSLSGEHGDGRLRGEFIPLMIGEQNYKLVKEVKAVFDPENIFNPGKIVGTPAMNTGLRFTPGQKVREIKTHFDFSRTAGILRAAEYCNGSADCRRTAAIGGLMCPSYMATLDENTTTRARANILREFLTHSPKENPFDHREIYEIMDLCLSCKGCKSECPSNVDMAKLKAEFLQHWYDANGVPMRSKAIANITKINRLGATLPSVTNFFMKNGLTSQVIKNILGFAQKRTIPLLYKTTLKKWAAANLSSLNPDELVIGKVYLFADEFTNYNDTEIGIKVIKLLTRLGYIVEIPHHIESGRTYISKGLVRKAKEIANKNVGLLKNIISQKTPLIGIEPSAILSFRDEYPELVNPELKGAATELGKCALMLDEFLASEMDKGNIGKELFSKAAKNILLHGHCQQKSLASTLPTKKILSFPENYHVEEIKSGCCGMAGSFGYEKEHYDLSMKVGELALFPGVRNASPDCIIAAPGTSCRHHIKDGTGRKALHPAEILFNAMI